MIRGFAFDLDETLVDCEDQHRRATRAMLEALGHAPDAVEDVFHDTVGVSTIGLVERYREHLGAPQSVDEMLTLRHAAYLAALDEEPAAPMPGARALLEACAAAGPIALVTNGYRDDAIESLRSAGLLPFFSSLVTADDVLEPKPHPEPYKLACARLGMPPPDVLAFEDSARGVASAVEAGCRVVAVPHPRSTKPDAVALADVVLTTLDEALPLTALLARLR